MSEIKLFDTWTFQEEVPEPFHQLLKKEGLRKTTTTLEWLSQYIEKQEGTIESLFFDWRIYGRTNEYSCAVTPQVRQTGNRLSGLAGTAYASLLT